MWHGRISVAFGYPSDGWVMLVLMTPVFNQHVVIYCTDVWQPFDDLFIWLNSLADKKLPCEFSINEEGSTVNIHAKKSSLEADSIEITVTRNNVRTPSFHCRTNRVQLIHEFIKRFDRWIQEDYDMMHYGFRNQVDLEDGYGFNLQDINLLTLKSKVGLA